MVTTNSSDVNQGWPRLGVMILNHNGERWLPSLYQSLLAQTYPQLKIYLVDNASSDSSISLTRLNYPEVKILRLSANAGFCIAYNLTMPIAFSDDCEWVIWANNDLILESGCLHAMGRSVLEHDNLGVLGPAFLSWDSDQPNYYMSGKHPEAINLMQKGMQNLFDADWVEGSFLMTSARCVEDVGWLDPFLFFYWEDADYCRRAIRKGWRVVLVPSARVHHFGGGTVAESSTTNDDLRSLKSRNYYIHALTNPNRSFAHNLIAGFHLFLVRVKASLKTPGVSLLLQTREFLRMLMDVNAIWHKWRRDRKGVSPNPITPRHADTVVEIMDLPATKFAQE